MKSKKAAPAKKMKKMAPPVEEAPQLQVQQQAVQYPVQPVMQAPVQQAPITMAPPAQARRQVGYYGGFGMNHPPQELPGIFNDDEPLVEAKQSVKEIGQESKV